MAFDGTVGAGTKIERGTFGVTAGVGNAGRVGSTGVGTPGPGVVGTSAGGGVWRSVGGGADGSEVAWADETAGRATMSISTGAAFNRRRRARKLAQGHEIKRAVAAR